MKQLTIFAALCVIAVNTSLPTFGQDKPSWQAEWMLKTFQIEFPGGTLEEYIAAIEKQVPEMNLVVADDVKQLNVQGLTLKNVTADGALSVVEELLEPEITIEPVPHTDKGDGTPVAIIRREKNALETAAFLVKGIPEGPDAPDVAEVLDFAMESLPDQSNRRPPILKLHPESRILIVTADANQLRVIGQVIELLGGESRLAVRSLYIPVENGRSRYLLLDNKQNLDQTLLPGINLDANQKFALPPVRQPAGK